MALFCRFAMARQLAMEPINPYESPRAPWSIPGADPALPKPIRISGGSETGRFAPFEQVISGAGIEQTSRGVRAQAVWSEYSRFRRYGDIVLLFPNAPSAALAVEPFRAERDLGFSVIARKYFRSEEDWLLFTRFLETLLPQA
jgi:hypothetical protein